jgi:hypothetical protein
VVDICFHPAFFLKVYSALGYRLIFCKVRRLEGLQFLEGARHSKVYAFAYAANPDIVYQDFSWLGKAELS